MCRFYWLPRVTEEEFTLTVAPAGRPDWEGRELPGASSILALSPA